MGKYKVYGYSPFVPPLFLWWELLWLPVCRWTLKGKNLLLQGANSFLWEMTQIEKGGKNEHGRVVSHVYLVIFTASQWLLLSLIKCSCMKSCNGIYIILCHFPEVVSRKLYDVKIILNHKISRHFSLKKYLSYVCNLSKTKENSPTTLSSIQPHFKDKILKHN